jgi:hypothetical protein
MSSLIGAEPGFEHGSIGSPMPELGYSRQFRDVRHFRLSPKSGGIADIAACLKGADKRHSLWSVLELISVFGLTGCLQLALPA